MENGVNDAFIKYNHENKALKFAYKKLKKEINKKIVLLTRNKFGWDNYSNKSILLGRRHCALFLMAMEKSLDDIDIENFNHLDDAVSELKLWGMPIYVSIEDPYKVEIICNLGSLDEDHGLYIKDDPDQSLGKKPLIDMEDLINDLPDHMKIKKVINDG